MAYLALSPDAATVFLGSPKSWPGRCSPLVICDPSHPIARIDILILGLLRSPVSSTLNSVLKVKAQASPHRVGAISSPFKCSTNSHYIKMNISMVE